METALSFTLSRLQYSPMVKKHRKLNVQTMLLSAIELGYRATYQGLSNFPRTWWFNKICNNENYTWCTQLVLPRKLNLVVSHEDEHLHSWIDSFQLQNTTMNHKCRECLSSVLGLPLDLFLIYQHHYLLSAGEWHSSDRLVSKAAQLINNNTTNLSECYISIRAKMDGGKQINRIQSGSFEHRCMAAGLSLTLGPGWTEAAWKHLFGACSTITEKFATHRERKLEQDTKRKSSD